MPWESPVKSRGFVRSAWSRNASRQTRVPPEWATASAGLLRTLTSYAMGSLMPTRFLRLEETCHMLSGCRIGRVSLVVSPVDGPGTGSVRHDHDEAAGHRQILPEMQHLIQVVEIGVEEQPRQEAEPGKNERRQPRVPAENDHDWRRNFDRNDERKQQSWNPVLLHVLEHIVVAAKLHPRLGQKDRHQQHPADKVQGGNQGFLVHHVPFEILCICTRARVPEMTRGSKAGTTSVPKAEARRFVAMPASSRMIFRLWRGDHRGQGDLASSASRV